MHGLGKDMKEFAEACFNLLTITFLPVVFARYLYPYTLGIVACLKIM